MYNGVTLLKTKMWYSLFSHKLDDHYEAETYTGKNCITLQTLDLQKT